MAFADLPENYPSRHPSRVHVLAFVAVCNNAKHKALGWRAPFQNICDGWQRAPSAFKIDPRHLIPAPKS
jgi:hypothetical protein